MLFTVYSYPAGELLWRTDGTAAGTYEVRPTLLGSPLDVGEHHDVPRRAVLLAGFRQHPRAVEVGRHPRTD